MDARSLSTSMICQQLQTNQVPIHVSSTDNSATLEIDPIQAELNRIANQASNLGFGSGVILRKLYEGLKEQANSMNNYCLRLSNQFVNKNFFRSLSILFNSEHPLADSISEYSTSIPEKSLINDCKKSAASLQRMTDCVDATLRLEEKTGFFRQKPDELKLKELQDLANEQKKLCCP